MDRELLLLGLLRGEGMHGYQLHDFINKNMSSCVELKKPTAYYLLEKMAEAGWVDDTEDQEGNRPTKHVYKLTVDGETAFQSLLRENISTYHPVRFAGDIGIAFLDTLPPDEVRDLLQLRRNKLVSALADAEHIPKHTGSSQLVIDHLVRHLKTELDWLDEVMERIE